jgi:hypothetical protein
MKDETNGLQIKEFVGLKRANSNIW